MMKEYMKMTAIVDNKVYGNLLMQVLPSVITDEEELERLTEEVDRLITKAVRQGLSPEEDKLLKLITKLIEDYEDEHFPMEDLPSQEILKAMLENRGMKQKDLVVVFGSEGIVSEILSGKRPITLKTAQKLADFFNCPREYFL